MIDKFYKGQTVYYVRVLKTTKEFEIQQVTLRTVNPNWLIGVDIKTHHACIMKPDVFDKNIFLDKKAAQKQLKEFQKHLKT